MIAEQLFGESAEDQEAMGWITAEELQSRYFPEPHIPNVKFFLQGKKRQPVSVPNASGMSLDELAGFRGVIAV